MKTMNFDKWVERASKKVEKMSPEQRIAMLCALVGKLQEDSGEQIVDFKDFPDILDVIAAKYDIEFYYPDEDYE